MSVPALDEGEVHLWRLDITAEYARRASYIDLLTDEERARAARYLVEPPRQAFAATRATLRRLLGAYVKVAPATIRFEFGEHGKPFLAAAYATDLHFNVSHSGDRALLAFTRGRALGVDIELPPVPPNRLRLVERFFAPGEVTDFRTVPPARQAEAFLNGWTRKEAFLKAHGAGLTLKLHSFEVELRPGHTPALRATHFAPGEHTAWTIQDVSDRPDYAAALAVHGVQGPSKVRTFTWQADTV